MPRISEFYGIVITMFHRDHAPAHFHAEYGEHEALIEINPIRTWAGSLPPRIQRLVLEWAHQHQDELTANWRRARRWEPLERIDPLS